MGKYKVGDVAALFSKPKDPTTEGGKKLQSLFQDFYGKKGKSTFQPSQSKETPDVNKEKESKEAGDEKLSKKNRKRKFSSVNESETNDEAIHSFKKMKQTVDTEEKNFFEINQNKKAKQFPKQKDFPRKRNKKFNVNGFNSNNNFPKFEEKFDSEKVFGGFVQDNQDDKQKFTFTKKSKRQSFESKNDSFSHNQSKLPGKVPGKNLAENSFDSNKSGKQNLNFIKKSKRQSLESKNDSFSHNQNKLSEEVPDKNLANNSLDSPKSNKSGKQKKKKSKPQSLKSENDSLNQNDKLSDEVSNKGSEDNGFVEFTSMKKHKNKKQKSKYQNMESESGSHNQNKLSDEIPDDGDSSLKNEIKEFMKNNSKKFKNNSNDFVPKSPPKVFNQRMNITYAFKQKSQPKAQSNVVTSATVEIKNNVPTRQVADFIRNPKKRNRANEPQSQKKLDETSNQETTDDNDNLFKSEDEEKDEDEPVFKKMKFRDNYLKEKVQALTAGLPEPDFVKIANRTQREDERLTRTLFVGNLPINTNKKALHKLFSVFGEVQLIRFHGVETDKAKIFSKDSSKSLNPQKYAADTLPGFIVFRERESAIKALALNGTVFQDHHITVDFALPVGVKRMYDEKRSIFIGNLPFSTTDESIWNTFSQCGQIESVRVVRDKATGIGKGFGYVLFKTVESRDNALTLKDVELEGRIIRIKAVDSNKKTQKNLKSPVVKKDSFKSRAIKLKRNNKDTSSRKSINKIMKKQKSIHNKKKIASILQKSMK